MRNKQKISFIIHGMHYFDPAPLAVMQNTCELMKNKKVPFVMCMDQPHNIEIEVTKESLESVVGETNKIFTEFSLGDFQVKNHNLKLSHYNLNDLENLKKELRRKNNVRLHPSVINDWAREQQQFNANKNKLLLFEYLIKNAINYEAIDLADSELKKIATKVVSDSTFNRVNFMVERIFNQAIKKLNGADGIIYISVGVGFGKILEAQLKSHINFNHNYFEVYTFFSLSPYYISELEKVKYDIEHIHTKKFINIDYDFIEFKEDKSGKFHAKEFDEIIDEVIKDVKNKKFFIPNFDIQKKEIVEKLGGEFISVDDQNFAKIEINSNLLKEVVRKNLEIDRMLLTINKEIELVKKFLKYVRHVTLEIQTHNKLLVTYPNDKFNVVECVVKNWNEVKLLNGAIINEILSDDNCVKDLENRNLSSTTLQEKNSENTFVNKTISNQILKSLKENSLDLF